MTNTQKPETEGATETRFSVDADVVFDVLSDSRRRFVLAYLREFAEPVALADLAGALAEGEYDAPIDDVPESAVESIHVQLYHRHVPKLAEAGIAEYDRDIDAVTLSDDGEALASSVDLPEVTE